MTTLDDKKNEFGREMHGGQAAGRPAWQRDLPIDLKLEADRLMNAVMLSSGPTSDEAIERWWEFRARYAALKEQEKAL